MTYLVGSGLTAYGRHEGQTTLDLMSQASAQALSDAGLARRSLPSISAFSRTMPTPCKWAVPLAWAW
jgi:hypothetical protein